MTRRTTGATPLSALEAVAIDSETTGLDTASARILQLAGIAVSRGRVVPDEAFDTFVAPGEVIPPASTAIHGLTDAMVRGAPPFAEAWGRLKTFAAGRILVGHSIGFDLAVLENEASRAGFEWRKPRSLCVRLLGAIANPRLPDTSLEALAGWLGVGIGGRHSAIGDARAAADIFVALQPHLAERGIRTLAEAERACLDLTSHLENAHRAGWAEPVSRPDLPATGQFDPYAYRHRVRELMSTPAAVITASATAQDAVKLMTERRISSVFVSDAAAGNGLVSDYGIVTERDVMRLLAGHGERALAMKVGEFASRPLASIAGGAFVYRAISRMDRLGIRHLAVRDESERLAGVISSRDLLRLRAGAAIHLDDAINAARGAEEMAQAWATLPAVANALISEGLDARLIAGVVSEELRVATRRAAELAEEGMRASGAGGPPCRYAVMVLGSGGRGESLLAADQDNAIVFEHGAPDGPEDRWFADLGRRIADILDVTGIAYCRGGIMARNAEWRGSSAHWRARIDAWVRRSRPEDLLNVDIFFDQRPVHGELSLGTQLFAHAFAAGSAEPAFAKLLGETLSSLATPFNLIGGLRAEEGRLDLKNYGLFPIVTAARTLSIRHGIRRRSTRGRLEGLIEKGIGGADELENLIDAHAFLLSLLLAQQSRDLELGVPVSNRVEIAALSRARQSELKSALRAAQNVPDLVQAAMFA
ncbi:DUF294 nucleotidyltransferase-like domain-containing protein [Aquamicrobium sp. LC103]|uniref:DUF294 nucleotidyltransferase-like domain-containing protein n=1 Tax=Aquamicrobium sp. LC103 TaxID=1120658 RepID=UPI00063E986E|nr:DUF294 nucleotidyltransferase-like domain-containing protein [Aquamicrobium sp. LC103]TKT80314.1 CBS domain-containing protein [Aquamicrobium sp. LC103]